MDSGSAFQAVHPGMGTEIAHKAFGQAASPLRAYLNYLSGNPRPFAFATICGGALNANPGLEEDLEKRAGAKPAVVVDLHIADLLPPEPKPTMKDTSAYRLSGAEVSKLAGVIADSAKSAFDL